MSHEDILYLARNNSIDWQLTADGVAINHTTLTRAVLYLTGPESVTLDSDVDSGVFDFSDATKLIIKAGNTGKITQTGNFNVKLVVYDASNPQGLTWFDNRKLLVK